MDQMIDDGTIFLGWESMLGLRGKRWSAAAGDI